IAPADSTVDTAPRGLIDACRDCLGPQGVLDDAASFSRYAHDWAQDHVGEFCAVLRPVSASEVAKVCQLCAQYGVGIVPQGGHTGLVAGAQQTGAICVLLSLERMNQIEEIDPENMSCTVQAGVVLETLQTALTEHGLRFGVEIGSQGTAQIGGLVSTNAGGIRVVRHGMTAANVLGLEVVLPDGKIVSSITGLHKDNRGPDPTRLAIGAEGSLGLVTRACLKVLPQEAHTATAYVGCDGMAEALALLGHVRRSCHEVLAAFEVMSDTSVLLAKLVNDAFVPPLDAPTHVLVELSSVMDVPLQALMERALGEALEAGLAQDVIIAQSQSQAKRFWAIREGLVEGHSMRGYHVRSDISVKLGRLPTTAAALETMLRTEFPDWIPQTYGHMGDGNLHFNALPPLDLDVAVARQIGADIEKRIFEIATDNEGSFSAEHGIGRTKARWFRETLPERHDVLARIKCSLDPGNMMNPGCLVTTRQEAS
ncbi:MAG: FAD-binding oxidoreductase, partial [Rhodobacteraceae bacterium]|nr:FAD-binding oxidoreductase [Paracoccaceae bacterium]